jgi:hypothetical protein
MRLLCLLVLVTACGPDDGDPIGPCRECGPGAIRSGRFIAGADNGDVGILAANRRGDLARAVDGELEWLANDFTVASTQTYDAAPSTYDPKVSSIRLADDGVAFVSIRSDNDFGYDTSIVALDADHDERWRLELGSLDDYEDYSLVGDHDVVVMTGQRLTIADPIVTTGDVVALDGGTHAVRWRRRFPQQDPYQQVLIRLAPEGGPVIVAGSFNNTLDFGGSVGVLHATGSFDAFVAGLDRATGDTLWATQFSVEHLVVANANQLAVGPGGEVALAVGWETSNGHDSGPAAGPLTVGTQIIDASPSLSRAIALLDPTGDVRWIQPSEDLISLVTDGTRVFGGARAVLSGLSAAGVDWRRPLTGAGYHVATLAALAGDRLLGSITSIPDQDQLEPVVDGDVTIAGQGVAYVEIAH